MHKKVLFIVFAAFAFSALPSAFAQGTIFTYQGRLSENGIAANGIYDLRFAIFDAVTNGNEVGPAVTNSAVVVSNGLFTTALDFGAGAFDGNSRWLETGVQTNGESGFTVLSPRQPLTASPYAIQSLNAATANVADSASSVSASDIIGTIPPSQLPAVIVTNGQAGVNLDGNFTGNGAALTNIPLNQVNSGGSLKLLSKLFTFSSSPGVGFGPHSVAAADVNGDGSQDLISANFNESTLTILTNNGSGVFGSNATIHVGSQPNFVLAVDVNHDDKPDLVSANGGDNTLTVLTNNGSGTFGLSATVPAGAGPVALAAADVNGDSAPDLICADFGTNTVTILTNNGTGNFVVSATATVGYGPRALIAADMNGDSKMDLVTANYEDLTLSVLINVGGGAFLPAPVIPLSSFPRCVAAADVNGDKKLDLIAGGDGGSILQVFTNDGAGTAFSEASAPTVGNNPDSIETIDVNGDGKTDLVVCSPYDSTLRLLINTGDGVFTPANTFYVGNYPVQVIAKDINKDGRLDLIDADSGGNSLTILTNDPGAFSPELIGGVGIDTANPVAGSLTLGTNIYMDDHVIYLRGLTGADPNHGLAYNGNTTTNFGAGQYQVDGPVLWGYAGGALGTTDAGDHAALVWGNDSVTLDTGTAGALTVLPDGPVPELVATNSSAYYSGYFRLRNHIEVWPNDAGTAQGYIDIRATDGTPNISLDGQSGKITCISLSQTSDRNAKADCAAINPRTVLAKVAALPISEWVYKTDAGARHIGPMAQDFHAAFGLNGSDDKHITTVDEGGVALAAIQGLNQKLEGQLKKKDAEIEQLQQSVAELKQMISQMARDRNSASANFQN